MAKDYILIDDISRLKVGDHVGWCISGIIDYMGVIEEISNNYSVSWRLLSGKIVIDTYDNGKARIYSDEGNVGLVYIVYKVADTKIARELYKDNIYKIEGEELWIKPY